MSDYYERLAGIALANHGLNRDNRHELARWAEAAAARGDTQRGVVVTGDGRLHAETVHPPRPASRAIGGRIESAARPPWQIIASTWRGPGEPPTPPAALSDALEAIQAATGLPAAHIVYREVCTGWSG